MKWQEVRELFSDQFLLVSILEYREEGTMVYHTSKEEFVIHIRRDPLMKVRRM